MKIKEYIKELLFANQGVILPGLGGFVSEYESAAFDVNENKIIPPSKKISFKAEYSYADDLLTDYIVKSENIDKEQAIKDLNDFVKDSKQKLQKGEKIEFPEIGTLWQSAKGQILFDQNKKANLLTDSFGLSSVKAQPHLVEPSVKEVKKQKKSYKKIVLISSSAIVSLLILAAAWYFTDGYKDFNKFSSKNQITQVQTVENRLKEITARNLDSIAKADSIKALIVESIDVNTDKKDALYYQEPQKSNQGEAKPEYSAFHIIAGSFKEIDNAEKFAAELREKGFNPEILHSGEKLIRISIFSYTDETEALTKLYKLRETSDIQSVWILKSI